MKYGWRERISGAVILVALGAIFLPMLFDDPEPRQQEPGPVMVIEQPVDGGEARQRIIESPQPPASVASNGTQNNASQGAGSQSTGNQNPGNQGSANHGGGSQGNGGVSGGNDPGSSAVPEPDTSSQLGMGESDSFGSNGGASRNETSAAKSDDDPIADIAQSNQTQPKPDSETESSSSSSSDSQPSTPQRTAASSGGGWVVQVGSFGQSDNASRLAAKLKGQGFTAYSQPRDNNLTTVYVGPYDSSDAGEKARAELKQAANIQGLLIRKPGS